MSIAINPTPSVITAVPAERAQLAEAARNFEAIFLRQMLSAARESAIRSDLFGSNGSDTFRQMRDEAFADIASQQGVLGLAAMIEAQLAQNIPAAQDNPVLQTKPVPYSSKE